MDEGTQEPETGGGGIILIPRTAFRTLEEAGRYLEAAKARMGAADERVP